MRIPKAFRKILIRATFFFLILTLLIALAGIVVSEYYSENIKTYVINNLNKELAVKVEVGKAQVSAIKKFPHINMILENVVAYSSVGLEKSDFENIQTDTLFKAANIYLRFNIIDIISGNYYIKKIIAEDGELTMLADRRGNVNYMLLRKTGKKEKRELSVELEFFKMKHFKFFFHNIHKDIQTSGIAEDINLKGKFGRKDFMLSLIGNIFIENLSREGICWTNNSSLVTRISMNASDTLFTINRGDISLNDLKLRAKGMFTTGENFFTDLTIEGNNLAIKEISSSLPSEINKFAAEYSPDGKADILIRLKGKVSSLDMPGIIADYKVKQGSIRIPDLKTNFTNISFNGFYSNGKLQNAKSSSFRFENISASMDNSEITGSLSFENLISPLISANLTGNIYATDINQSIATQKILFTKGVVKPDIHISAKLNSFSDFDIRNILSTSLSGELFLKDIGLRFGENYPEITSLEGKAGISDDIWLTEIGVETSTGDMYFSGRIDHLIKRFVKKTSSLWIQGSVFSNNSDLSFILSNEDNNESSHTPFLLPDKLFMKLDLSLDKFAMSRFNATEVTAHLVYKSGFLNVSSFQLNTMKGDIKGYGGLIQDASGNLILKSSTQLNKLDIKEMFEVFNNFQQDFITNQNLGGKISGVWELSTSITSSLNPDLKTTWSEADILIENGELRDFEPLKNLSRFIEVSELEHVKFQTLQNKFIVKDSKVYIPKMDINSSAFNLSVSGTHSFENYFDYSIKVNLSEILANKASKKKENDEFAVHEKSGQRVNIFLTITGTPDDFKIKYDRREALQQIKEDLKTEKKELKTILNQEFGFFKKQFTDSVEEVKKDPLPKFIFEWDEEDEIKSKDSLQEKKQKESSKKSGGFTFDRID